MLDRNSTLFLGFSFLLLLAAPWLADGTGWSVYGLGVISGGIAAILYTMGD